jgi:outer membrane lipoprotein-sorting protein
MKHLPSLLVALAAFVALPASALDGAEILRKVDRNLEPESYDSYRQLVDAQPDGTKKEYVLWTIKKGRDKVIALFLAPASDKGRATLRQGDSMWLYMPDVGRPIRVTSLQSVTGSVFNNADILRIDYSAEYDVREAQELKDGTLLLDLKAKTVEVAYDRLKMTVDAKLLLPTTIEAYAASGILIKTLRFSNVKDFGK